MKRYIKIFLAFWSFRIEGQKLGPFLVTKYIKYQSYQNMLLIKVGLLFFIFYIKRFREIRLIFDMEKWLWMSELCCFRPSILKQPKGQKYFDDCFHFSWRPYLFTTELSSLQKNKSGHTKLCFYFRPEED